MESSTPLPTDMRRRTLLRQFESSPLRRSMNASVFEEANDEAERSQRRQNAELQVRLSNLSSTVHEPVRFNESYIKEQFAMCTHLFTENKINVKNVWKLQIIDMLKPLCERNDEDKLQVACTSIDISAKIYGIRVDDIHSDGLKLASTMARMSERVLPQGEEDEEPEAHLVNEQEKDGRSSKKKKRRRVNLGEKNTVVASSKLCTDVLPKLEPVDFTTRVNAETGSIDNLFTNALKEDNSSCTFVILDSSKSLMETIDPVIRDFDAAENSVAVGMLPPRLPNGNLKINSLFQDFRLDGWDPDHEDSLLNADTSILQRQVVFDENGFPIHELDSSIPDIFENCGDNGDDDIVEVHEEIAAHQARGGGEIPQIVDFRATTATSLPTSEYSYNSLVSTSSGKFIDRIWAGPQHWKLKCLQRPAVRFSGQVVVAKEKRRRRKSESGPIVTWLLESSDLDYTKKLPPRKRRPNADISKITLPLPSPSCLNLMDSIRKLMLKPEVSIQEKKPAKDSQMDYEVDPYKYENPNDSLYCSQQSVGDDADDNFANGPDGQVVPEENFVSQNLVDAPQTVPVNYVPYALKAKQMDMKKLKGAIWKTLTKENPQQETRQVVPQNFSELYGHLPDSLAEKERKELTCPLAFVALLHLCNEQNLVLTQVPGNKDFKIRGPEGFHCESGDGK